MKKTILLLFTVVGLGVSSCELLTDTLSNDEIVNGLKTALTVGADSAVNLTSKVNGYYTDQAIKIVLPPEAKIIEDNIQYVNQLSVLKSLNIDLNPLVDNVYRSMNKAAESAAKKASPIFKESISNLSITDGLTILNGRNPASNLKSTAGFDSIAATNYLISTTRTSLVTAYKQPVDEELNKDLGLGFSTNDAWSTLVSNYNQIANVAQTAVSADIFNLIPATEKDILRKFQVIQNTSLGEYVTGKAIDGLFIKIGVQEKAIRRNPWRWISETAGDVGAILQKVFGNQNQ